MKKFRKLMEKVIPEFGYHEKISFGFCYTQLSCNYFIDRYWMFAYNLI